MVPPRQPKTDIASADEISVPGGSTTSADRLYDLSVKVAGIERSITYLEAQTDSADEKLDLISAKITASEARDNTLKWFLGAICVGIWGPLTAFGLMWAKHYFNW